MNEFLINGPEDASHAIVLAHGAGIGMDAPFMVDIAQDLAPFRLQFSFAFLKMEIILLSQECGQGEHYNRI